ncbi:MAG: alpha/beta hydrolase [Devosia sp.]|nr:alpha/beta hydrolase [Devosia sp.]
MSRDSYIYRERAGNGAAAPLLLLLHGTGGDEDQFFDVGGQLLPGAQLISLRGDVAENGALRFFRRLAEGRYDMADLDQRTDKLIGFIKAHAGTGRAVYGLGYSNGANILASVLFKAPELFDGTVLMHPLIPFTPPPAPGLVGRRVLITAGRRDPIAPTPATEALVDYFEAQGAAVTTHWHAGGHELRQEEFAAAQALLQATVTA